MYGPEWRIALFNVFPPLSNHVTSTSPTLAQSYWVLNRLGDVHWRVICKTPERPSQWLCSSCEQQSGSFPVGGACPSQKIFSTWCWDSDIAFSKTPGPELPRHTALKLTPGYCGPCFVSFENCWMSHFSMTTGNVLVWT